MKRCMCCFPLLRVAQMAMAQVSERVVYGATIDCRFSVLARVSVLLPVPQSNHYQTVQEVNYIDGVKHNVPNSDDKYVRFQYNSPILDSLCPTITGSITYHTIYTDFSRVNDSAPYDTTSEDYIRHIGKSGGDYVDPDNEVICDVADSLWLLSGGVVNYARDCYEYVARHFSYLNPNTGLHPLTSILRDGGGDCGNLSSVFVSLLRNKRIPARHVVSFSPSGGHHVWAEFLVQGYGWIPVDVTYHKSDLATDYFGRYDYNAVVVGFDVGHEYSRWDDSDTYTYDILQTFHWWYWGDLFSGTANWRISRETLPPEGIVIADRSPVNAYSVSGVIMIEGGDGEPVGIYNAQGQLVYVPRVVKKRMAFQVRHTGFYIVRMANGFAQRLFVVSAGR